MNSKCDDFTPAKQPISPSECKPWPQYKPEDISPPAPFKTCCSCPNAAPATTDCFESLIKKQSNEIAQAESLKPLKAELEAIQAKAKAAAAEYTREKWQSLLETWKERDCCIAQLIQRLLCSMPNWKCLIDCYLCPMLHELSSAEVLLGERCTNRPGKPSNLHDLRYWAERNRAIAQRELLQVSQVLKVWEKPVAAIEKVLADNSKLIQDIEKDIGSGMAKVVYDLFFKLIPKHLAIAPVAEIAQTKIDKKYTEFCDFDTGVLDDCCGTNVGRLSLRERLIGPLPHLIEPNEFAAMICCVSQHRYLPAMKNVAAADGLVAEVEEQIKREKSRIEKGLKDFEKDALSRLPLRPQSCCSELGEKDPNKPENPGGPKTEPTKPCRPTATFDDDNTIL